MRKAFNPAIKSGVADKRDKRIRSRGPSISSTTNPSFRCKDLGQKHILPRCFIHPTHSPNSSPNIHILQVMKPSKTKYEHRDSFKLPPRFRETHYTEFYLLLLFIFSHPEIHDLDILTCPSVLSQSLIRNQMLVERLISTSNNRVCTQNLSRLGQRYTWE